MNPIQFTNQMQKQFQDQVRFRQHQLQGAAYLDWKKRQQEKNKNKEIDLDSQHEDGFALEAKPKRAGRRALGLLAVVFLAIMAIAAVIAIIPRPNPPSRPSQNPEKVGPAQGGKKSANPRTGR